MSSISENEWKEAHSRVEIFLQALELTDWGHREEIIEAVMKKAAEQKSASPELNFTTLAMGQLRTLLRDWIERTPGLCERTPNRGLVSLWAIDTENKWPGVLFAKELPRDLQQALVECEVRAAPELSYKSMVPEPFDNPLGELMLPPQLAGLAKREAPLLARMVAIVLSLLSVLWFGNRMR